VIKDKFLIPKDVIEIPNQKIDKDFAEDNHK
jgi:hypothetical protein